MLELLLLRVLERLRPFRVFLTHRLFGVLVMQGKAVEFSLSLTCADLSNAFHAGPCYMLNLQVEMFKLILCLRSDP